MDSQRNSTDILFDATFKVVPRLFYQLLTIFTHFWGHTLPALHFLMTENEGTIRSCDCNNSENDIRKVRASKQWLAAVRQPLNSVTSFSRRRIHSALIWCATQTLNSKRRPYFALLLTLLSVVRNGGRVQYFAAGKKCGLGETSLDLLANLYTVSGCQRF